MNLFPLLDRRSAQITAFELLTQKVWMTSHNEIRRIFFQKFETLNDLQNTSILNKIKFPNSDKKRHDHLTTLKFVAPWPGRSSFNITTPTSFPPPTHPQHTPAHTLSPNLFLKPKSPHTFSPCSWQKRKKNNPCLLFCSTLFLITRATAASAVVEGHLPDSVWTLRLKLLSLYTSQTYR